VEILVNNAGIGSSAEPIEFVPECILDGTAVLRETLCRD